MEKRIGFGRRLGAFLLDVVIIYVLSLIIGVLGGAAIFSSLIGMGAASGETEAGAAAGIMGGALGGILAAAAAAAGIAFIVFLVEGFTGYTPGKFILGIRVANADGSKAGIGSLLTRFVIKNIQTVMLILAGITGIAFLGTLGGILGLIVFIGFFFILGEQKQGFHDKIAKTAVYNKADIT